MGGWGSAGGSSSVPRSLAGVAAGLAGQQGDSPAWLSHSLGPLPAAVLSSRRAVLQGTPGSGDQVCLTPESRHATCHFPHTLLAKQAVAPPRHGNRRQLQLWRIQALAEAFRAILETTLHGAFALAGTQVLGPDGLEAEVWPHSCIQKCCPEAPGTDQLPLLYPRGRPLPTSS